MARNVFDEVSEFFSGRFIILVFVASVVFLLVGLNHFYEDLITTVSGLRNMDTTYGMQLALRDATRWSMSLFLSVGQVVFFYMYLSNTDRNFAFLLTVVGLILADSFFDIYARMSGQITWDMRFVIAFVITTVFFTVGSELAVSFGWGVMTATFSDALSEMRSFAKEIMDSLGGENDGNDRKRGRGGRGGNSGGGRNPNLPRDITDLR